MSRIAAVQSDTTGRFRPRLLPVFLAMLLPACATAPSRTAVVRSVPVPPTPVAAIYVYPAAGQSAARLDRDRYACHLWAVQQSRFDPGLPDLRPTSELK
ncbi:MAG: hypothetical protein R3F24_10825 [Gammaproteobacteria bacterium]